MKTGLESLDTGAPEITYSGNEGPKSPQQIADEDFMLLEEYQKYVFEMQEQGLEPMSIQEFRQEAMSGMASNNRMQQRRQMVKNGGMTKKIKGQEHMLAYITPGEAKTLESLGGQKTMTPEGIPAYPPPGSGAQGPGGSGGGTGGDQTGGGGGGGGGGGPPGGGDKGMYSSPSQSTNREKGIMSRGLGPQGTTGSIKGFKDEKEDDKGNPLQNRNQRNIVEYNKNLKEIEEDEDLSIIERFNAKKKLKNQRFINQKYSKLASGIAQKYGLSQDQLQDLLDAYEEDPENQIGLFSKMQGIFGMDPSARKLGQDFNEDIMKGPLGAIELSPRMKKGVNLSTAELFNMADPTTRIDLPSPFLNMLQGDPNFSGILSGLNRLSVLDTLGDIKGGVPQSEIDNYFSLTMGKGGINPLTGKEVPFLFNPKDDNDRSMVTTTGYVPPSNPGDPGDPGDPDIPVDPVTGQYSNEYLIPGGSNFYSNLPSTMFNPTTNMLTLANGGRANYAGGGIADLRQGYFLGKLVKKFTKPFKGITKGFKKILKSPLGKAAILYGLGSIPFGATGATGFQRLGGMFAGSAGGGGSSLGGSSIANYFKDLAKTAFKPKNAMSTITGLSALGGLYTSYMNNKREDETMEEYQRRLEEERRNFADIPINFVNFADGGIADARTSALNELYDIEEQKLAAGGSAGYAPVTMQTEGNAAIVSGDDQSGAMAQGTTLPNQMPRRSPMPMPMPRPMMNPMMARGMNPMMGRGMPMMGGRMMAQEGGMMDMGGMEKDYRNEGGFVAIGGQERADDVPARLSKNEFVFTADAVRNAGGGNIDKGAEIMENMMENLEAGGKVSEDSQGLQGARAMFATQKRLGEVL